MSNNPSNQDGQIDTEDTVSSEPTQDQAGGGNALADTPKPGGTEPETAESGAGPELAESGEGSESAETGRPRRILIGSQRDPAAYLARRSRDWTPLPEPDEDAAATQQSPKTEEDAPVAEAASPSVVPSPAHQPQPPAEDVVRRATAEPPQIDDPATEPDMAAEPPSGKHFPPPNLREELPPDLERELEEALGDESVDELLAGGDSSAGQALEEESQHTGRVVAVRRDDVFVELGSREQGCLSARQFEQPPEVGATLEVIVRRFNPEDGLYELTLPGSAVEVDDWADINEGMLVEARITGHNTGGLECEVGRLRGFIPVSQVSLYRVEDLAQFVDEKFACLITEANPERRNLVLSRRAVLEREKEEARQQLLESLQPGQVHEGVVRKLVDFGAFVEIGGLEGGGMDGLLHISQLGWHRVQHPSEILAEGQTIKVKIQKIDRDTGRMSLAYRDLLENPWDTAERKFPVSSEVEGTVTKLMEFGAFVELEPGIEGLVHISELSHKRVWRSSDVVHEGEKVKVLVLSVDTDAQRISLSIKQTYPDPEPKKKDDDEPAPLPAKKAKRKGPQKPLTGGLDKSSGGDKFGLKW